LTAPAATSTTATLVAGADSIPCSAHEYDDGDRKPDNDGHTFDKGDLIVSHDGAIVATTALGLDYGRSAASTLAIAGLRAALAPRRAPIPRLYYVSVRVWNSADPAGTLTE